MRKSVRLPSIDGKTSILPGCPANSGSGVPNSVDPRLKLAALISFVLAVNLTRPSTIYFALSVAVVFCAAVFARLALSRFARRFFAAASFAALPAAAGYVGGNFDGARIAVVLSKSCACIAAVSIFSSVTTFGETVKAMGNFGMPRGVLAVAVFLHRYYAVVADELINKKYALALRPRFFLIKTYGYALADIFGRSYKRSAAISRSISLRSEGF
ncbi:MAG: hypothetical protein CVU77_02310 [Elusimicrobia bacterium HGW-Elusimicrobia-1]|jgi:energy-coupling factor transporter transmembrane protein EcfT|nr:MAG: hypothetical protein CVU77_02310 [Elusimicrobia bacterium HGW-Elusimicrobia-1]